jgi:anti-anti-sigma factor
VDDNPYAATYDADNARVVVSGSVDELSGQAFRSDLEKYSDGFSRDVAVDLSGVDFFPSLAVGVLAVAMKNAREAGTTLTAVADPGSVVARVLTICALPFEERTS